MSSHLPQLPQYATDAQRQQRQFDLSMARTAYNYMFSYLEPLSLSADVPEGEGFTPDYNLKVLLTFAALAKNFKDVILNLLEKDLSSNVSLGDMASLEAVEQACKQLLEEVNWHSIAGLKQEFKELQVLLAALAEVPGDLAKALAGAASLPGDVVKMAAGLEKVFKEFEEQGFTAFLKNTAYYMLDTSDGRDYLNATSLQDYLALYDSLPRPQLLTLEAKAWMAETRPEHIYQQDWYFAYMQTAGFNTTNLHGVRLQAAPGEQCVLLDALLEKMPFSDQLFQQVLGDDSASLAAAAEQHLLYVCDYAMFAGIPGGELHERQRYPVAPIALFYWNAEPPAGYPTGGALQPIAIQLGQQHDAQATPIFTPNDCTANNDGNGAKWQLAKLMVQNACAIQHETVAHLGACHLVIEPMVVAAHRQLPAQHPLMVLLKPHFRFTLEINAGARHSLIVPGGVVASVVSSSYAGTAKIITDAHAQWRFDERHPERLFARRGVDADSLPDFPFRDDTLLLWQAIKHFVHDYLTLYYGGDEQLAADKELQAWVNEMVDPKYAAVKGMHGLVATAEPDAPWAIDSLDYLVDVVAQIIYTASAQHASVNYAQYPLMSFVPSVPGTLYKPAPGRAETLDADSLLEWLPPLDVALYQLSFGYLLSGVQYDTLGCYSTDPQQPYFTDPRVAPLLTRLQVELGQAEIDIQQRNRQRPFPYMFQLPSLVPNSISI